MADQPANAFWAEMSACPHFVPIYQNDEACRNLLSDFGGKGLTQGEASVIVATPRYRIQPDARLRATGIDVRAVEFRGRFISIDAQHTLSQFMVHWWPDDGQFFAIVADILKRASQHCCKIRAFGEMVVLMWAQRQCSATVRLKQISTALRKNELRVRFCANSRVGFTESLSDSIARNCAAHSKVLAA